MRRENGNTYTLPMSKGGRCGLTSGNSAPRREASDILWVVLFNCLFFAPFLQKVTGFTLVDECVVVFVCLVALVKSGSRFFTARRSGRELAIIVCLALWVFLGLLESFAFGIQASAAPVLIDVFTCLKFFLVIVGTYCSIENAKSVLECLICEVRVLSTIMCVLAIANLFVDFGMGAEGRFGISTSFKFIFNHPATLSFCSVGMLVLLLSDFENQKPFIAFSLISILLALRATGIGFAVLIVILVLWLQSGHRLNAGIISLCFIVALIIGWDQLTYYFGNQSFARAALTQTGFAIAHDWFPFGTGFGSFGSNITGNPAYYSSLYALYGIDQVQGLSIYDPSFLSDSFWPIIFGQTGWLGFALFLTASVLFAMRMYQSTTASYSIIGGFLFLIIMTVSSSAFFNPCAMLIGFSMSLCIAANPKPQEEESQIQAGEVRVSAGLVATVSGHE